MRSRSRQASRPVVADAPIRCSCLLAALARRRSRRRPGRGLRAGPSCMPFSSTRRIPTAAGSIAGSTSAAVSGETVLAPAAGVGHVRRAPCRGAGKSVTILTPGRLVRDAHAARLDRRGEGRGGRRGRRGRDDRAERRPGGERSRTSSSACGIADAGAGVRRSAVAAACRRSGDPRLDRDAGDPAAPPRPRRCRAGAPRRRRQPPAPSRRRPPSGRADAGVDRRRSRTATAESAAGPAAASAAPVAARPRRPSRDRSRRGTRRVASARRRRTRRRSDGAGAPAPRARPASRRRSHARSVVRRRRGATPQRPRRADRARPRRRRPAPRGREAGRRRRVSRPAHDAAARSGDHGRPSSATAPAAASPARRPSRRRAHRGRHRLGARASHAVARAGPARHRAVAAPHGRCAAARPVRAALLGPSPATLAGADARRGRALGVPLARSRRLAAARPAWSARARARAGAAAGAPAPARMIGADGDRRREEDPGRAGVAVCGGASAPWPRGGVRRPLGRVRPLPPAARATTS